MPDLKSYNAREVTAVFLAVSLDSGYGEDEFVRIEQEEDDYVAVVGADGEVTRTTTNNSLCTITFTFVQTSDCNTKMTVIHNLDKSGPNGKGVGPLMIKDRSGLALFVFSKAWIAAPPARVYGKSATGLEWKLQGILAKRFDGGSPSL